MDWKVKITLDKVVQSTQPIALRRIKIETTYRPGWYRVDGYRFERTGNPKSGRYHITKVTEVSSEIQLRMRSEAEALIAQIRALDADDKRYAKTLAFNAAYQWQGLLNMEPEIPTIAEEDELAYWIAAINAAIQNTQAIRPVLEEA